MVNLIKKQTVFVVMFPHTAQITYFENLIMYSPDYEYVGVFADRGTTGTTDNRPEFQRGAVEKVK